MKEYTKRICKLGIEIYDDLPDDEYFIPDLELEHLLEQHFLGFELGTLPARTRSKLAKEEVCRALGYPIPKSFKKTQPRFPGQNLDVYVQSSNNLQIWNEELTPERRYALIRPDVDGTVVRVRVIRGVDLAQFDTTGTFTSKFQARMISRGGSSLLSEQDAPMIAAISSEAPILNGIEPVDLPSRTALYSIDELYRRLLPIVGRVYTIPSGYSDRIRGEVVHKDACRQLGYESFADDGTFPDIKNQLLEVKAQTSPTIDLGLHNPSSDVTILETEQLTVHAHEVRYAIFDCDTIGETTSFRVNALYMVVGGDFDSHFPLFKGKTQNKKIQLPLPRDFFDVRPKQV